MIDKISLSAVYRSIPANCVLFERKIRYLMRDKDFYLNWADNKRMKCEFRDVLGFFEAVIVRSNRKMLLCVIQIVIIGVPRKIIWCFMLFIQLHVVALAQIWCDEIHFSFFVSHFSCERKRTPLMMMSKTVKICCVAFHGWVLISFDQRMEKVSQWI